MECTKCHSYTTKYLRTFTRRKGETSKEYECLECNHVFVPKKRKQVKKKPEAHRNPLDDYGVNHLSKVLNINPNKLNQWLH